VNEGRRADVGQQRHGATTRRDTQRQRPEQPRGGCQQADGHRRRPAQTGADQTQAGQGIGHSPSSSQLASPFRQGSFAGFVFPVRILRRGVTSCQATSSGNDYPQQQSAQEPHGACAARRPIRQPCLPRLAVRWPDMRTRRRRQGGQQQGDAKGKGHIPWRQKAPVAPNQGPTQQHPHEAAVQNAGADQVPARMADQPTDGQPREPSLAETGQVDTCQQDFQHPQNQNQQPHGEFDQRITRRNRQAARAAAAPQHQPAKHRDVVPNRDANAAEGTVGRAPQGEATGHAVDDDVQKTPQTRPEYKQPGEDQKLEQPDGNLVDEGDQKRTRTFDKALRRRQQGRNQRPTHRVDQQQDGHGQHGDQ